MYYKSRSGKAGVANITFIMSREDAVKFCSDERTSCKRASWAFFFDTIDNALDNNNKFIKKMFAKNNGKQDKVIEELGLTVYSIEEAQELLDA